MKVYWWLLFFSTTGVVMGQTCSNVSPTTIVYGNGIRTTRDQAVGEALHLKDQLKPLLIQNNIDPSCIPVGIAYDGTFINPNGVSCDNPTSSGCLIVSGLQILQSAEQIELQYPEQFWYWWSNRSTAPDWFNKIEQDIGVAIGTGVSAFLQPDVFEQINTVYHPLINQHRTIIAVTHSQGNLYVNQAYNLLFPSLSSPGTGLFNVIAVASPADHVAGNGPYTNLLRDPVVSISPLLWNIDNGPCVETSLSTQHCDFAPAPPFSSSADLPFHDFRYSYLDGEQSGKRIYDEIMAIILVPAQNKPSMYTITDLGVPPNGTSSSGLAINNLGDVVGYATILPSGAVTPVTHAAEFKTGSAAIDFGVLTGDYGSTARGINIGGKFTGESSHNTYVDYALATTPHAFLYDPGSGLPPPGKDIGTLYPGNDYAYSVGYGINSSGQVVGYSGAWCCPNSSLPTRAFRYDPGAQAMTDIGTLGSPFGPGANARAYALNDAGQITGQSDVITISGTQSHAFLYTPGTGMVDLGTLGGDSSEGWSINSSGVVVGDSNTTPGGYLHAFLYDPTTRTMVDLQTAGGTHSHAYGVNSAGQVVGYWVSNNAGHAFLYTRDKGMVDLTTLLAPGSGSWVLQWAQAINDVGQITGYGKNSDGATHAFLLSPVQ